MDNFKLYLDALEKLYFEMATKLGRSVVNTSPMLRLNMIKLLYKEWTYCKISKRNIFELWLNKKKLTLKWLHNLGNG